MNNVLSTVLECGQEERNHNEEILEQLKNQFHSLNTTNVERILILTLAPKSWSARQTAKEFDTSRHKVKVARKLVEEHGISTSPNPKPEKSSLQLLLML